MASNGIVRHIDELGRIVIPKEIRRELKIEEGGLVEISYDHNGSITIKTHRKSFEQCAIDWYHKAMNPQNKSDLNFQCFRTASFKLFSDYTFCIVGNSSSACPTRGGFAKRFADDIYDERIGKVAAYAKAMGHNLNKMIGYEG